jgi:hypothetical protein
MQIALVACIVAATGILAWQLASSLPLDGTRVGGPVANTVTTADLSKLEEPESGEFRKVTEIVRPGLFKSETPLSDKPMADKTIEKIRSQLKLQCIMDLHGEPVAYVRIKGEGMKRCKIGESVIDLFTVLDIHEKSILISIVGHKTILSF